VPVTPKLRDEHRVHNSMLLLADDPIRMRNREDVTEKLPTVLDL